MGYDYQEKQWKVITTTWGDDPNPPVDWEANCGTVCISSSGMANQVEQNPYLRPALFLDVEMVAAELEFDWPGGKVGRLTESWEGSPAGNIVIMLFSQTPMDNWPETPEPNMDATLHYMVEK